MTMEKEQFEELCSSFALGAISRDEEEQLFSLLQSDNPEFQKIFYEHLSIVDLLNKSIITKTPSPRLHQKLLKRIAAQDNPTSAVGRWAESIAQLLGFANPRYGLAVAALLMVVIAEIAGYTYLVLHDAKEQEMRAVQLESQLHEQRQRFNALESEYELHKAMTSILQSRTVVMVVLNGLDINPSGYGKIIWDPQQRMAILQFSRLPVLPGDKEYQLWIIDKNKKPLSAGLFAVHDDDESFFKVSPISFPDDIKEISALAVTMEPKGGVPLPTGAMYLLGTPSVN